MMRFVVATKFLTARSLVGSSSLLATRGGGGGGGGGGALRAFAVVAVGDRMPPVKLHSGFPPDKVDCRDLAAANKRVIFLGLPGAFTPT
jgi:hypothetical protein